MRFIGIIICFAATLGSAAEITPSLPPKFTKGYTLAWHDEFDGATVNTSEWTFRTGDRFGSRSLPKNVTVSDGQLHLHLKKEPAGPMDYTSGGVISKREFKHGYYEARMRVPPGKGWHSSFWMMKNSKGEEGGRQEIDVVEHDSYMATEYGLNLHLWKPEHVVVGGTRIKTPRLDEQFHTWGCEFAPREIRFYFDGRLVFTHDATSFTHDAQSIWLSSVGWTRLPWSKDAKIDDTKLPASTDYEYVRFFEKANWDNDPVVGPYPRTVIVFGDSITAGGALPKDQRASLWVSAIERESGGSLAMINEGKGGRPTNSVKEFDDMLARRPKADELVIALGMNDSRDITDSCVPKAVANVRTMIEKGRKAYGPKLRVLLVGPSNINKQALGPTKPIANERDAKLRDLGSAFAKLAEETKSDYVTLYGTIPDSSLTTDGVHPDAAGNAAIAGVIKAKLQVSQ